METQILVHEAQHVAPAARHALVVGFKYVVSTLAVVYVDKFVVRSYGSRNVVLQLSVGMRRA